MTPSPSLERLSVLRTIFRLLTFRSTAEELDRLDIRFLWVGLLFTWLVGMGRYWDSATANVPQKTGLGSVVYVFALSAILWVVAAPFRPHGWGYRRVLTFITLTSFPAALYALPVERWMDMDTAIRLNVWFLSVVALYRVALYLFFMGRGAKLGWFYALVAVMLPVTSIIAFIVMSGYGGIVLDMMGGFRDRSPDAQQGVKTILMLVTFFGCLGLPIWGAFYWALIAIRTRPESV